MNSLMVGSSGYAVESLQDMLNECGNEIDVTGSYDDMTRQVVSSFQKKEKIVVTGIADERTLTTLAMRSAVVRDE